MLVHTTSAIYIILLLVTLVTVVTLDTLSRVKTTAWLSPTVTKHRGQPRDGLFHYCALLPHVVRPDNRQTDRTAGAPSAAAQAGHDWLDRSDGCSRIHCSGVYCLDISSSWSRSKKAHMRAEFCSIRVNTICPPVWTWFDSHHHCHRQEMSYATPPLNFFRRCPMRNHCATLKVVQT
jgi:hypothetical protein